MYRLTGAPVMEEVPTYSMTNPGEHAALQRDSPQLLSTGQDTALGICVGVAHDMLCCSPAM